MTEAEKPQRHDIARSTILFDRAMNHFIKVGGFSIIAAVFAIFVFIVWQILPLFRGADVSAPRTVALPAGDYVALGADEWSVLPFAVRSDATFVLVDTRRGDAIETLAPALQPPARITALSHARHRQEFAVGTADGAVHVVKLNYEAAFREGRREVSASLETGPAYPVGTTGAPVVAVHLAGRDNEKMVAVLQDVDGRIHCRAATFAQKRSLIGGGRLVLDRRYDLTEQVPGRAVAVLANARADGLLVGTDDQHVHYFGRTPGGMQLRQTFAPFDDDPEDAIATMDYLLGDDSVVFTSRKGRNVVFSLFAQGAGNVRLFTLTKTFPALPDAGVAYAPSFRNKAFVVASRRTASLRFSTTQAVRWQQDVPFDIERAALGGKYDHLLLLDRDARLHLYELHDPHPEAGLNAFFGKIWYEGAAEPKYDWQSTGGSDEFEPKLSMVPLIIGTLKGTLYAMLFSVPLALLAALYTSQFAQPGFKRFIKPTMEIMASLPSVILGFLAALWLAPLLETRVPSIILMTVFVPGVTIGFGWLWSNLPFAIRRHIRSGSEFIAILPMVLAAGYVAWHAGPWLTERLFVGRDAATGQPIADFRLWWTQVVGLPFEQRNSLVVGFMMGFAVIPIIFTITEDALSNVPPAFRSASLALGASRWQTAIRVILPTASAGIFSAVMIGFGRAVGETMIVLMATGNTPIMDFNIFSGMRTLSANIAVELPEAPHHSTLFRALYLGALLLFLFTFVVNTMAELLRHHLREKFKAV